MSCSLLNVLTNISKETQNEISKHEFITLPPNFALLMLPVLVTAVGHLRVHTSLFFNPHIQSLTNLYKLPLPDYLLNLCSSLHLYHY